MSDFADKDKKHNRAGVKIFVIFIFVEQIALLILRP